jgi:hypothetical protein
MTATAHDGFVAHDAGRWSRLHHVARTDQGRTETEIGKGFIEVARYPRRYIPGLQCLPNLNTCGTVYAPDGMSVLDLGGHRYEIVVTFCRALSCRYLVNCIAVRPKRYGSVANRNRLRHSSQHHGRRAEAGGKATEAGGKATRVRSGGKHGCTSPDIPTRTNAIARARFDNGQACRA